MNLNQTHPRLYQAALLTLIQTAIGQTGSLFDVAASVQVFSDPTFVCEDAEDALMSYLGSPFESVMSLTAQYYNQEDEQVQRIIIVMANDHQVALAFVSDPDETADFLDEGEVEFKYGKNVFAYDALEIGYVAKVLREFTLTGIAPDGNRAIAKEEE